MKTNDKSKREPVYELSNWQSWQWSIRQFPMGRYEVHGRQKFYELILDMIQDWPISDPERATMAYIAEKTWREGRCRESIKSMIRQMVKGLKKSQVNEREEAAKAVYRAVCALERGGLIHREPVRWTMADDAKYRINGNHDIYILNVMLRDLVAN
jgi:hypothetical protein